MYRSDQCSQQKTLSHPELSVCIKKLTSIKRRQLYATNLCYQLHIYSYHTFGSICYNWFWEYSLSFTSMNMWLVIEQLCVVYIKKIVMQSMNRMQQISPQTMVYVTSIFFYWNQTTVNGWTSTLTLIYKLVMKDASNYSITWQGLLLVGVK